MKYENKDIVDRVYNRIRKNKTAIQDIDNILEKYPNGNSDGSGPHTNKKLYSLHISEYGDDSCPIKLSGSMIQTEVLEYTKQLLEVQVEKDLEYLKTL